MSNSWNEIKDIWLKSADKKAREEAQRKLNAYENTRLVEVWELTTLERLWLRFKNSFIKIFTGE